MGRGPARIRGRIRLAHAIVPMVLRKRAFAMPKKVPGSDTDALPYACRLLWRRHPARVPDPRTAALVWP